MSCCPHKKPPSLETMAKNLFNTMVSTISHAARTGQIITEHDLMERRLKICNVCPSKSGVRCHECGCFISLKVGVKVATCPIGKW